MEWKDNVREMLSNLNDEYHLPTNSLWMSDNMSQKEPIQLISHSVCIWEPDYPYVGNGYPEMNKIVLTIVLSKTKSRPNELEIYLRKSQEVELHRFLPNDAELVEQTKSDKDSDTIRIRFDKNSSSLVEYIRQNVVYSLENYVSKAERFGCCHLFEECSNAKKCIHKNLLYSRACAYRNNLENGNIFYGINKTNK